MVTQGFRKHDYAAAQFDQNNHFYKFSRKRLTTRSVNLHNCKPLTSNIPLAVEPVVTHIMSAQEQLNIRLCN